MKFLSAAVLCLVASTAQAFSPKAFIPRPGSGVLVPGGSDNNDGELWRPPMNMVAGGAERAYGQEYYEGKEKIVTIIGSIVAVMIGSRS